jgi:hypothetical protein
MTHDERQMANDEGRITDVEEGGAFEVLPSFIVHRSFFICHCRD